MAIGVFTQVTDLVTQVKTAGLCDPKLTTALMQEADTLMLRQLGIRVGTTGSQPKDDP